MSGDHNMYCSANQPDDPKPVAWMNKNHEGIPIAITQKDYNRQPTFIQKQWEGSAPLFTLDQLNQARADALREAADYFCAGTWTNVDGILREMAEEMEKGK